MGATYLAIDVGATKTLMALFTDTGGILQEQKLFTDKKYDIFLKDLRSYSQQGEFKNSKIAAVCCAIPGRVDRRKGVGLTFGNLPWRDVPIRADLEAIFAHTTVFVENDAKVAGLYEAALHKEYKKVLYITLSTGIGGGVIIDGKIDDTFADAEIGHMVLENDGKLEKWEKFASGKALVERFEKKAAELNNPFAWKIYAKDVAKGLDALMAVLQPDVIIIGGSVGAHFEKFSEFLNEELKKFENNMVPVPPIIKADKAEEAVVYGCYQYIKQNV